jgi:hypothetical protein
MYKYKKGRPYRDIKPDDPWPNICQRNIRNKPHIKWKHGIRNGDVRKGITAYKFISQILELLKLQNRQPLTAA